MTWESKSVPLPLEPRRPMARSRCGVILILGIIGSLALLLIWARSCASLFRAELEGTEHRVALYSLNGQMALRWNRGYTHHGMYLWPARMLDPDVQDRAESYSMADQCARHWCGFGWDNLQDARTGAIRQVFIAVPYCGVLLVLQATMIAPTLIARAVGRIKKM